MSIFALLASAIAARIKPESLDVRITRLQAKIDDLNREFDTTLARVTRQRDDWERLAKSYRDMLHERRDTPQEQHFINEAMRQQIQAQQAQMLGAQNFAQALDAFICNCVPARHDAFRGIMSGS
jgi:hypothetical protein